MKSLLIALVGIPTCGKTSVQTILQNVFNVVPVDDGYPLRDFAMRHMGATREQVYTQEGKASLAYWPDGVPIKDVRTGEHLLWRQVLGRIGNQIEALHGVDFIPRSVTRELKDDIAYSFASVRKEQVWFYRDRGGYVVEIVRPGLEQNGNDFDLFDPRAVTHHLLNDGTLADLASKVTRMFANDLEHYGQNIDVA